MHVKAAQDVLVQEAWTMWLSLINSFVLHAGLHVGARVQVTLWKKPHTKGANAGQ